MHTHNHAQITVYIITLICSFCDEMLPKIEYPASSMSRAMLSEEFTESDSARSCCVVPSILDCVVCVGEEIRLRGRVSERFCNVSS